MRVCVCAFPPARPPARLPACLLLLSPPATTFSARPSLFRNCSRSPAYTTLIDGPAWVDYFLLVELTKNPDGYR